MSGRLLEVDGPSDARVVVVRAPDDRDEGDLGDDDAFTVLQLPDAAGASTVVHVHGPLDVQTAPELALVLRRVAAPRVTVDVSGATVLCAAGFGVLATQAAWLDATGGHLQVVNAGPFVVRCLHLLHLGGLLDPPPDAGPALAR